MISVGILFLVSELYGSGSWAAESGAVWLYAVVSFLLFCVFWGYYIFFEMLTNGQSPGKRLVGLRVLRSNGTPIALSESVIRNLVRLIDFLPSLYGVGVVTMFIDRRSRRLGDLAAGTLVVHELKSISLANLEASQRTLSASTGPAAPPAAPGALPVERLSANELNMADEFLRRRHELYNRPALALRIAAMLSERLGLGEAPKEAKEAEKFIEQIVRAQQARYQKD
jgi:uncharacterized RDD family membrane protein YckC